MNNWFRKLASIQPRTDRRNFLCPANTTRARAAASCAQRPLPIVLRAVIPPRPTRRVEQTNRQSNHWAHYFWHWRLVGEGRTFIKKSLSLPILTKIYYSNVSRLLSGCLRAAIAQCKSCVIPVLNIFTANRNFVATRNPFSLVSIFVARPVFGRSLVRPSNLGRSQRFPSSECARKKWKIRFRNSVL